MNPLFSSMVQAPSMSINTPSLDLYNTKDDMYPGAQPRTGHRYNEVIDTYQVPQTVAMNINTSIKYNISTDKKSVSRVYALVNKHMPQSYWDYNAYTLKYNSQEPYEVIKKLGRGKYSEVFLGLDVTKQEPVVLKVLKSVKTKKIKREVCILENLGGKNNVLSLYDVVRDTSSKTITLILECIEAQDFKYLYSTLSDMDIRYYCYELLKGLDYAHSKGIMHRDIKPQNVMIDHQNRKLRIIDWGLAEFYHPHVEYHVRVASRYFKGPELLLNMRVYDYSLDVWSFGCMFAGMIFKIHPLFRGTDDCDQLMTIMKVVGKKAITDYITRYEPDVDEKLLRQITNAPDTSATPFTNYINTSNKNLCSPEAIDLLTKLLQVDHQKRLTAREAMDHPYFDSIRNRLQT